MSGYDLLKIVLNWAGAPLTAEDIKKHRCVRQSANSITVSSELLRDHRPEWDKLSNDITKVWQYSTNMLYSLLEQEERTGAIEFPDV